MSQAMATGAVALYINTGAAPAPPGFVGPPASAPELLGYGETAPRLAIDTKYGQVRCDLTGQQIPFDETWDGAVATVGVVLTVFNETVARKLERFPNPAAGTRGSWRQTDYGSLMLTENNTTILWVRFLFGAGPTAKAVYTGAGLVGGYRFPQVYPIGQIEVESGTRAMKRQFLFRAMPSILGAGGASPSGTTTANPTYTLFDNSMTAVQSLPIN